MKRITTVLAAASVSLLLATGSAPVAAQTVAPGTEATAAAIIHSVDPATKTVNVTHEPIPALGWPAMTMDLQLTRNVELDGIEPGTQVMVTIKLGRDNQYRITAIEPK